MHPERTVPPKPRQGQEERAPGSCLPKKGLGKDRSQRICLTEGIARQTSSSLPHPHFLTVVLSLGLSVQHLPLGRGGLTFLIPAYRRPKQEDRHEFEAHLGDLGLDLEEFRKFTLQHGSPSQGTQHRPAVGQWQVV